MAKDCAADGNREVSTTENVSFLSCDLFFAALECTVSEDMKTTSTVRKAKTLVAAAALFASQSVLADTIELSSFWAGHGSASISFSGVNYHNAMMLAGLGLMGFVVRRRRNVNDR